MPTAPSDSPSSSERRHLLSIDDIGDDAVSAVLQRAGELADGAAPSTRAGVAGLLFLSSSLRTKLGFASAAVRLGLTPVDITELRWGPGMSDTESFADTLRTASGMVEVLVTRVGFELDRGEVARSCRVPLVNGGDGGPRGEHPTQALIDLFAMERYAGPIGDLRVAICGDLTMRASRSLLRLFDRFPPRELVLIAPPGRDDPGVAPSAALAARTTRRTVADFRDVDVLHLPGLPEKVGDHHLDDAARSAYVATRERLAALPGDAVVLSPLPVIDEIAPDARQDPRIKMFEQSDDGVWVRAAVLEFVLRG